MMLSIMLMLGIVSLFRLPVGYMPDMASPGITVITRQPGVSPEKIEDTLTIPIERTVSDISGIEQLLSVSSEGESRINLIFDYESNIQSKILETSEKIQTIRDRFPRDVQEPYIVRYDPSDRSIFIVSFSSETMGLKDLRELIENEIKIKFERIEGVSQVFVGGGFEREIQIQLDDEALSVQKIPVESIQQGIDQTNVFIPVGKVNQEGVEKRIFLNNKFDSVEQISKTRIIIGNEKEMNHIRLNQIAEIKDHFREIQNISRTNGEERVSIYIQKAGNANTLDLTDACLDILNHLNGYSEHFSHHIDYNQGKYIRQSIERLVSAGIQGGLIVIVVLFIFLRKLIPTLLVSLSIPASLVISFFFMYIFSINLNVMSLSGLAIGTGMLIDNSIVISEAIEAEVHKKKEIFDAVYAACASVFYELISSTLTSIIVFLPLLFTEPTTKLFYRDLTLTVTISLIVSLLFSLTVLPSFIYTFSRISAEKDRTHHRIFDTPVFVYLHRTSDRVDLFLNRIRERYESLSEYLFSNSRRVFMLSFLMLLLSLPVLFLIGKDSQNSMDTDTLNASVELKTGTNLDHTEEKVREIEKILMDHPNVAKVNSKIEKWHADLSIEIDRSGSFWKSMEEYGEEMSGLTANVKETSIYFNVAQESSTNELNIDFFGPDMKALREIANQLSGKLQAEIPGVQQVVLRFRDPKEDMRILPRTVKLSQADLFNAEFGSGLRTFLSGNIVTKFFDRDREVDIRIMGNKRNLATPLQLETGNLPVGDKTVNIRTFSEISTVPGETKLWRKNKRISATITLKIQNRSLDRVASDAERILKNVSLPEDVTFSLGDEYKKLIQSQKDLLIAIFASVLLIYFLLGTMFESFTKPLIILSTVPLTLLVTVDFFFATGSSLNISIIIGLLMLCGIMVNTSIMLVSTIQEDVKDNRSVGRDPTLKLKNRFNELFSEKNRTHFIQAYRISSTRIRPILMTTLTTIFGMVPMMFDFSEGSQMWRDLSLSVSFGLLASLLINMTLIPLLYYTFTNMQKN